MKNKNKKFQIHWPTVWRTLQMTAIFGVIGFGLYGFLQSDEYRNDLITAGVIAAPHPVKKKATTDTPIVEEPPRLRASSVEVATKPAISAATVFSDLLDLGAGRYAGPQLDEQAFSNMLKQTRVATVIRLNTEARGEKILTRRAEEKICQRSNVRYLEFNIEGKNDRCGEKALQEIDQLMSNSRTFVHCTDGAYRSMLVAARYLARHTNADYDQIATAVGWDERKLANRQYRRYYLNAFEYLDAQRQPAK